MNFLANESPRSLMQLSGTDESIHVALPPLLFTFIAVKLKRFFSSFTRVTFNCGLRFYGRKFEVSPSGITRSILFNGILYNFSREFPLNHFNNVTQFKQCIYLNLFKTTLEVSVFFAREKYTKLISFRSF